MGTFILLFNRLGNIYNFLLSYGLRPLPPRGYKLIFVAFWRSWGPLINNHANLERKKMPPRIIMILVAISAWLATLLFSFAATEFALTSLLTPGSPWPAVIPFVLLSFDFAGISSLYLKPGPKGEENKLVWYLTAAWFLAATMTAMATWYGIALGMATKENLGNLLMDRDTTLVVMPVCIAIAVWLFHLVLVRLVIWAFSKPAMTEKQALCLPDTVQYVRRTH